MAELKRYKLSGEICITYSYRIDETIEAESEGDAIDALFEDLAPEDSYDTDTDTYALTIVEIEPEAELSEAQRMEAIGMPMLPGLVV